LPGVAQLDGNPNSVQRHVSGAELGAEVVTVLADANSDLLSPVKVLMRPCPIVVTCCRDSEHQVERAAQGQGFRCLLSRDALLQACDHGVGDRLRLSELTKAQESVRAIRSSNSASAFGRTVNRATSANGAVSFVMAPSFVLGARSHPVFTMPGGSVLRLSNWRRAVFLPSRARARLSARFRIHDLRHTAASLMIQAGYPPKMLQEVMGTPASRRLWTFTVTSTLATWTAMPIASTTLPMMRIGPNQAR